MTGVLLLTLVQRSTWCVSSARPVPQVCVPVHHMAYLKLERERSVVISDCTLVHCVHAHDL